MYILSPISECQYSLALNIRGSRHVHSFSCNKLSVFYGVFAGRSAFLVSVRMFDSKANVIFVVTIFNSVHVSRIYFLQTHC
jgi:hypothetical protein